MTSNTLPLSTLFYHQRGMLLFLSSPARDCFLGNILMLEPKVETLVPLILCSANVLVLLFGVPVVPDTCALVVAEDVPSLCQEEEDEVGGDDAEENAISLVVVRHVAGLVDVACDDTGGLDEHVVN